MVCVASLYSAEHIKQFTTKCDQQGLKRWGLGRKPCDKYFKFAFITDSHYHYDNFRKVIEDINKM